MLDHKTALYFYVKHFDNILNKNTATSALHHFSFIIDEVDMSSDQFKFIIGLKINNLRPIKIYVSLPHIFVGYFNLTR